MRWEYKVVTFKATGFLGGRVDAQAIESELTALGTVGWEACGVVDTNRAQGRTHLVVVLLERPRA